MTVGRGVLAALLATLLVASAACGESQARSGTVAAEPGPAAPVADTTFASWVETLSEPGGYFDTDNLISNETSYLHVVGALERLGAEGGAYIGVGPDQNFSYMAAVRPQVAFIVDIRRDNLLQHLLFKALFAHAPTRVEYLSLLHGVEPPADPGAYHDRSIEEVVAYVDSAGVGGRTIGRARRLVDSTVVTFGVPLSPDDRATIRRFHETFIRRGLSLRFTSHGRAPRPYYPTFRQLLLATDLQGRQANYLARRDDYLFLRELQGRNLVVPVVGDLAGPRALRAVADEVRRRGLTVSAFYTSNVEFYLFRNGTFDRFAESVRALPIDDRSALVRSYFPNFRGRHPHAVAGFYSTQSLQTIGSFVETTEDGGYRSYWELVTADALDPRTVGR